MSEQIFNTRIVHKHDTEANWNKATNFIPKQGELIVYDIDENYNYERFKIGDGFSNVIDLPFAVAKLESDLTKHTNNTTVHITNLERTNWNAAKTHADSAHAPSNAEPNQNAFSNIKVGSTTIAADSKTDTLTLVGSNVTITPDATNDKVTIGITKNNVTSALGYTPPTTDTKYTHPTTSGNKHIPSGGSSGQILRWSADGTAVWGNDNNTTYSAATSSTAGLMSAADKAKLDGIATGANKTTVDSALSSTSTNPVQNKVVKAAIDGIKAVPACATSNNGQFLRVVNGVAAWSTVPNAEEASF